MTIELDKDKLDDIRYILSSYIDDSNEDEEAIQRIQEIINDLDKQMYN